MNPTCHWTGHVIYKDPSMNSYFEIRATIKDQETPMNNAVRGFEFWEGSCTVSGHHDGNQIVGRAYLENPQLGGIVKYI
jgi:hypothetical protein